MTPNEELFWKRVANLKKMIERVDELVYKAMWEQKLVEITKGIGKKEYMNGK